MSTKVFEIWQSVDDEGERPDVVTYYDPVGKFQTEEGYKEFAVNCRVSAGLAGYPASGWFIPDLYASQRGRTAIEHWDYYSCATFGAFSKRAIDELSPCFGDRFLPLPARLEGLSYYCLHCRSRVDCLDRDASEIVRFDDDPSMIMEITKHRFHKEMLTDPMVFAIAGLLFCLFCTESVPQIATDARLRGFEFRLVDE